MRDETEIKAVSQRLDKAEKRLSLIETELRVIRGEVS